MGNRSLSIRDIGKSGMSFRRAAGYSNIDCGSNEAITVAWTSCGFCIFDLSRLFLSRMGSFSAEGQERIEDLSRLRSDNHPRRVAWAKG